MRPFLFDRVLRGEHEQRPLERVASAANGDLVFLHRLEQRRLRPGRRAIDFVGEDDVGEDRTADESNLPLPRRHVFFDDLGAENVGRHEVGRELDAAELQINGIGDRLDEQRLGETGHAEQ